MIALNYERSLKSSLVTQTWGASPPVWFRLTMLLHHMYISNVWHFIHIFIIVIDTSKGIFSPQMHYFYVITSLRGFSEGAPPDFKEIKVSQLIQILLEKYTSKWILVSSLWPVDKIITLLTKSIIKKKESFLVFNHHLVVSQNIA